jgi:hypothetical protein
MERANGHYGRGQCPNPRKSARNERHFVGSRLRATCLKTAQPCALDGKGGLLAALAYKQEVGGSIPSPPTEGKPCKAWGFPPCGSLQIVELVRFGNGSGNRSREHDLC